MAIHETQDWKCVGSATFVKRRLVIRKYGMLCFNPRSCAKVVPKHYRIGKACMYTPPEMWTPLH